MVEPLMDTVTVLITNDDGVASPGLAALVRAAVGPGRRVVVAAPSKDQSGTSAAVAPRPAEGTRVERVTIAGLDEGGFDDLIAYSVAGPPALAVLAARVGELGPAAHAATIVASGVNLGPNTGAAVLHSGTVGAALAAANLGLSGLAVSMATMRPVHLGTATVVAAAALDRLAASPPGTVLNVNVPDLPLDRLKGIRRAPLACFGTVEATVRDRGAEPFTFQLRGQDVEADAGTDSALLREGWVTVTSLLGVRADEGADVAGDIERAISRAA
jgi:5'-nucleotidase